ncbi:serine-rich adhesin for platelets-like [Ambystoma mexicanum]|uniref:serine-rich adhesin for platelets-like n=1 Tax=Ambystoma mexicanum TaxID=8296 RepID=UPI0037E750D7
MGDNRPWTRLKLKQTQNSLPQIDNNIRGADLHPNSAIKSVFSPDIEHSQQLPLDSNEGVGKSSVLDLTNPADPTTPITHRLMDTTLEARTEDAILSSMEAPPFVELVEERELASDDFSTCQTQETVKSANTNSSANSEEDSLSIPQQLYLRDRAKSETALESAECTASPKNELTSKAKASYEAYPETTNPHYNNGENNNKVRKSPTLSGNLCPGTSLAEADLNRDTVDPEVIEINAEAFQSPFDVTDNELLALEVPNIELDPKLLKFTFPLPIKSYEHQRKESTPIQKITNGAKISNQFKAYTTTGNGNATYLAHLPTKETLVPVFRNSTVEPQQGLCNTSQIKEIDFAAREARLTKRLLADFDDMKERLTASFTPGASRPNNTVENVSGIPNEGDHECSIDDTATGSKYSEQKSITNRHEPNSVIDVTPCLKNQGQQFCTNTNTSSNMRSQEGKILDTHTHQRPKKHPATSTNDKSMPSSENTASSQSRDSEIKSNLSVAAAIQIHNNVLAATSLALIPFIKLYDSLNETTQNNGAVIRSIDDRINKIETEFVAFQLRQEVENTKSSEYMSRHLEQLLRDQKGYEQRNKELLENLKQMLSYGKEKKDSSMHKLHKRTDAETQCNLETELPVTDNLNGKNTSDIGSNPDVRIDLTGNGTNIISKSVTIGSVSEQNKTAINSKQPLVEGMTDSINVSSIRSRELIMIPGKSSEHPLSSSVMASYGIFRGTAKTLETMVNKGNALSGTNGHSKKKLEKKKNIQAKPKHRSNTKQFIRNLTTPVKTKSSENKCFVKTKATSKEGIEVTEVGPKCKPVTHPKKRMRIESDQSSSDPGDQMEALCNLSTYSDNEADETLRGSAVDLTNMSSCSVDSPAQINPWKPLLKETEVQQSAKREVEVTERTKETLSTAPKGRHLDINSKSNGHSALNPKYTSAHSRNSSSNRHDSHRMTLKDSYQKIKIENIFQNEEDVNLNRGNIMCLLHAVPALRNIRSDDIRIVEYLSEVRADIVLLHIKSQAVRSTLLAAKQDLRCLGFEISLHDATSSQGPTTIADNTKMKEILDQQRDSLRRQLKSKPSCNEKNRFIGKKINKH